MQSLGQSSGVIDLADERCMLYSIGGIPNRRSSSGRLASKVKLVVAAMANFSLNKIRVLMMATGGI
jgi:hypothetical protein